MPQLAVPHSKMFVYLKSVLPDMLCQFITFLVEEADRAAAGRAAAEKVCVPKIGFARHALLTHFYSRWSTVPQLAVSQLKICVPKISFARHALPTHYIFSHILSLHGCAAYCSGDPLIPLVHAADPGFILY